MKLPQFPTVDDRDKDLLEIDLEKVPSAAIRRLIDEVRQEGLPARCYNRIYNRHNRS